jgi:hypothetical protein
MKTPVSVAMKYLSTLSHLDGTAFASVGLVEVVR